MSLRLIFIWLVLLFPAAQMKIKKTKVKSCFEGYYLDGKAIRCLRIPGPLCIKAPKPSHFMYGRCSQAKLRKCPIQSCASPGELFSALCICVSHIVKKLIEQNYNYKAHRKRFIQQFSAARGVNSRIAQCARGYRVERRRCVKSEKHLHCRNKCKAGFEVLSPKCVCAKSPACKIKACKAGHYLKDCRCIQNKTATKVVLKRLGLLGKAALGALHAREVRGIVEALRKKSLERAEAGARKVKAGIEAATKEIAEHAKEIAHSEHRKYSALKKQTKQRDFSFNLLGKDFHAEDFDLNPILLKYSGPREETRGREIEVPKDFELSKKGFFDSIFGEKKTDSNLSAHQKALDSILEIDFSKMADEEAPSKPFARAPGKPAAPRRQIPFFANLTEFKKLVRKQERFSRERRRQGKRTIAKCKFGFFLDFSRNQCRNLPAKYNQSCSKECTGEYYLVPGLCTCMVRQRCPVRKCLPGFRLTSSCKCLASALQVIDVDRQPLPSLLGDLRTSWAEALRLRRKR